MYLTKLSRKYHILNREKKLQEAQGNEEALPLPVASTSDGQGLPPRTTSVPEVIHLSSSTSEGSIGNASLSGFSLNHLKPSSACCKKTDCAGWKRLESTHVDHLDEENQGNISLWTEDLSIIREKDHQELDTSTTSFFTAPNSIRPNQIFSARKPVNPTERNRDILANDSSNAKNDAETSVPNFRKNNRRSSFQLKPRDKRRSVLGRNEVILLTSESDSSSSDDENAAPKNSDQNKTPNYQKFAANVQVLVSRSQNNSSAKDKTPEKCLSELMSESRIASIEKWIVTSPFHSESDRTTNIDKARSPTPLNISRESSSVASIEFLEQSNGTSKDHYNFGKLSISDGSRQNSQRDTESSSGGARNVFNKKSIKILDEIPEGSEPTSKRLWDSESMVSSQQEDRSQMFTYKTQIPLDQSNRNDNSSSESQNIPSSQATSKQMKSFFRRVKETPESGSLQYSEGTSKRQMDPYRPSVEIDDNPNVAADKSTKRDIAYVKSTKRDVDNNSTKKDIRDDKSTNVSNRKSFGAQVSFTESESSLNRSVHRNSVGLQVSLISETSPSDVEESKSSESQKSKADSHQNTLSDIVGKNCRRNIFGNLLYLSDSDLSEDENTKKASNPEAGTSSNVKTVNSSSKNLYKNKSNCSRVNLSNQEDTKSDNSNSSSISSENGTKVQPGRQKDKASSSVCSLNVGPSNKIIGVGLNKIRENAKKDTTSSSESRSNSPEFDISNENENREKLKLKSTNQKSLNLDDSDSSGRSEESSGSSLSIKLPTTHRGTQVILSTSSSDLEIIPSSSPVQNDDVKTRRKSVEKVLSNNRRLLGPVNMNSSSSESSLDRQQVTPRNFSLENSPFVTFTRGRSTTKSPGNNLESLNKKKTGTNLNTPTPSKSPFVTVKKIIEATPEASTSKSPAVKRKNLPFPDDISTPPVTPTVGRPKPEFLMAEDFRTPKLIPGKLSFLESLSFDEPNDRCHPEAIKYVTKFKLFKDKLLARLFNLFNEKGFDSSLPKDMSIIWNPRLTKTAGVCIQRRIQHLSSAKPEERISRIELSTKVLDSADRLRDTLVHEMCHAASWIVSGYRDGHGPVWKAWAKKVMTQFPELPIIARCHAYAIRTKYAYRCTRCFYEIGRHSKSIDVDKKCCGLCRGKFQLLVNGKVQSSVTSESGSSVVTPNKFAIFVKENYKQCRTPGKSHSEAMKALSLQFAQAKLTEQKK